MKSVGFKLSRCVRALVLVTALAISGCENKTYEVDYTFQVLKKKADGTFEVVGGKRISSDANNIKGGGFDYEGVGLVSHGVRSITKKNVTLYVVYPDQTTETLEVGRGESKEHYHRSGDYGIRFTIEAIRSR